MSASAAASSFESSDEYPSFQQSQHGPWGSTINEQIKTTAALNVPFDQQQFQEAKQNGCMQAPCKAYPTWPPPFGTGFIYPSLQKGEQTQPMGDNRGCFAMASPFIDVEPILPSVNIEDNYEDRDYGPAQILNMYDCLNTPQPLENKCFGYMPYDSTYMASSMSHGGQSKGWLENPDSPVPISSVKQPVAVGNDIPSQEPSDRNENYNIENFIGGIRPQNDKNINTSDKNIQAKSAIIGNNINKPTTSTSGTNGTSRSNGTNTNMSNGTNTNMSNGTNTNMSNGTNTNMSNGTNTNMSNGTSRSNGNNGTSTNMSNGTNTNMSNGTSRSNGNNGTNANNNSFIFPQIDEDVILPTHDKHKTNTNLQNNCDTKCYAHNFQHVFKCMHLSSKAFLYDVCHLGNQPEDEDTIPWLFRNHRLYFLCLLILLIILLHFGVSSFCSSKNGPVLTLYWCFILSYILYTGLPATQNNYDESQKISVLFIATVTLWAIVCKLRQI